MCSYSFYHISISPYFYLHGHLFPGSQCTDAVPLEWGIERNEEKRGGGKWLNCSLGTENLFPAVPSQQPWCHVWFWGAGCIRTGPWGDLAERHYMGWHPIVTWIFVSQRDLSRDLVTESRFIHWSPSPIFIGKNNNICDPPSRFSLMFLHLKLCSLHWIKGNMGK